MVQRCRTRRPALHRAPRQSSAGRAVLIYDRVMRWTVLFAILLACGGGGGGGNPPIDATPGSDATPSDTPASDGPGGGGDAAIAVGPQCDAVTCTNGTRSEERRVG